MLYEENKIIDILIIIIYNQNICINFKTNLYFVFYRLLV